MRMTKQRTAILEALKSVKTHPTADEVYEMVRSVNPRISLGTVYRNLEAMASEGVIQKLEGFGSKKRFDGDISRHYHIECIRCGRVDDIFIDQLMDIEKKIQTATNYKVTGHSIEFVGICPSCKT